MNIGDKEQLEIDQDRWAKMIANNDIKELRRAFHAGRRSSMGDVDADIAAGRWSMKNCNHSPREFCDLQAAWYDGFEFDLRPTPTYMGKMRKYGNDSY